jgi:hypothetical protein
MSRAASMFQALQGRFLGLLEAYREKVPGAEAPAPEPEAVSEPEPAPELAPEQPVAEVPSEEPAGEALAEEPSTMEDVETSEDASSATNEEE